MPASFPIQTIGILGGGQLGRMMALAARAMGFRIIVLDPDENCPCAAIADRHLKAAYEDEKACLDLLASCDVITYEFENVPLQAARLLESKLPQSSRLLEITQDRILEKESIRQLGFATADYLPIRNRGELEAFAAIFQSKPQKTFIKTARGGYDGRGQFVLRNPEDLTRFIEEDYKEELAYVAENAFDFDKELSAIVCRNARGECRVFPIAENIHRNQILYQSLVPARIPDSLRSEVENTAKLLAEGLKLQGTLAIEIFRKGEEIRINELAPRPHNSGHFSLDACETSQFEQHIRAICNLPLGEIRLHSPCLMQNVLGEEMPLLDREKIGKHKLHLYGKEEARTGRKMGHINVLEKTLDQCLESAKSII